ncbi:MAG: hypothetical protein HRF42_05160 [Candidatus Brocadia sp.]|jgi:hypothetical protein
MVQKLLLPAKASSVKQKISMLTSLSLVALTLGTIFIKTLTIDDFSVAQKTAINATVADDTAIVCVTKATGDDGNSGNDKSGHNYSNNRFQKSTVHGKEFSCCCFIRDNHWSDNDDVHYDEEEDDTYEDDNDECRENKYEWKDV